MNASRLRRILLDAVEHVPFYRQHWRAAGVDLTRIPSAVHLEFLPVVRKSDLMACPAELRIDQRFVDRALRVEPSGTCAARSVEAVDPTSLRRRRMRLLRALMEVGYTPGERLMLVMKRPFHAGTVFLRWTCIDSGASEDEIAAAFARARPHVLYAPLNVLQRLARHMPTDVTWRPKLLVSTGAPLTDAHRALLESAFDAPVADFYVASVVGLIAFQRPGRAAYEVLERDLHVERVPAGPDGLERLIVTDLCAGATPLIRYDTEDLVRRDRERPGAPIVEIRGRRANALEPANGAWLSPHELVAALARPSEAHWYARPDVEGCERLQSVPPAPGSSRLAALDGGRLQRR